MRAHRFLATLLQRTATRASCVLTVTTLLQQAATRAFRFLAFTTLLLMATLQPAVSQSRPPVIDMHVHSTTTTPASLARLDSLGVRYLFLAGLASDLRVWSGVDTSRYLPALVFPCDGGRAPITGRRCFEEATSLPDTLWLRAEIVAGRVRAFGEVLPQFMGLSPGDPVLEPYWRLAEEYDLPVGIHMGPGPPGAAYESSPAPVHSPAFRMAAGDPLLLEDVLLRHPRLRLFVMHAGWPRLGSMLALLYAHPGVYVDVAGLQSERIVPQEEYERYLRALVKAGFARRIMFGSDFPDGVEPGIRAILTADFLTAEQKSDILCGNAARFLRLASSVCDAEIDEGGLSSSTARSSQSGDRAASATLIPRATAPVRQ
jgi:hypothetical protein